MALPYVTENQVRIIASKIISESKSGSGLKDYILNLTDEEEPSQEQLAEIYNSKPDRIIIVTEDISTYCYKQVENPEGTRLYYATISVSEEELQAIKIEFSEEDGYILEFYSYKLTPIE